jgi:UDP-N-acetylmuramoylalanine--D-glutamate ligase
VLKGEHNKENMLAAAGCGMSEGVPAGTLQKTIESFRGLEHRNEECGRLKQRVFVNDSKATTVNAVRMALLSAKGRVILLMGGRSKGDDFSRLDGLVRKKVRTLVCFGEAAKEIRSAMPSARAVEETRTLAEALGAAWKKSRKGDTILLSPGCTSFDAFKNFEERGRVFKDLVKDLTVSVTSGVRK